MNYNHLRYFWMVARVGKLTEAAEQLNLSQSALSAQIKKLEYQIGHELFERRGRRLVLTAAGQTALDYADSIFSTGDEMLARLQHSDQLKKQILRVGALSTLSRNFQIKFIRDILQDDNINVIMRSGSLSELIAALKAHRLDVVLVNQIPLRDSATPWTARIIDEQGISLIGTKARIAGRRSMKDLMQNEPLLLPTAESGYRNNVDILFEQLDIIPNVIAEVDDMAMLRLLAREDIGLAILPPIVVIDELSTGRLQEAYQLEGITESFAAITLKGKMRNPVLDKLF